jgi:ATP-dependent Lon protease
MKLPDEVGVMTLPNVTLFPQALLPLRIFEPRYRRMLADALATHRMFVVAMPRTGSGSASFQSVAGLGLIRVAVEHADGTSHLILQGLTRVTLEATVRLRPYRVQRVSPVTTLPGAGESEELLLRELRNMLQARLATGAPLPVPFLPPAQGTQLPPRSAKAVFAFLRSIEDPERAADLTACAVLSSARDRQTILETPDLPTRLRQLINFLTRDVRAIRNAQKD